MLSPFDWLRRCESGAELLSILGMLHQDPDCFTRLEAVASLKSSVGIDESGTESNQSLSNRDSANQRRTKEPSPIGIGPVPNALAVPCSRCWLYPRLPQSIYCGICRVIRNGTRDTGVVIRDVVVAWGYVNFLPAQLQAKANKVPNHLLGIFIPDEQHFVALLRRREIHPWLQDLVLYYGADFKGHIQIFPTMGSDNGLGMGDILCRAIRHEGYFQLDKLRIRFYTRAFQVLRPHEADKEGLLTFEVAEFLSLLEMASIFRSLITPADQKMLYELLTMPTDAGEMFYWGRVTGSLTPRVRDLLEAWQMRSWPANRVKFFYELMENVDYQPAA
ncbi:MAG: hypothetical protein AAF702_44835 [Chloroflexota bacterium]